MYRIDVLFCKFVLDGVDFSRFFFLSAGNWLKYSGYAVKPQSFTINRLFF